jgi:nucleotide-binding universal stress UspA family protein
MKSRCVLVGYDFTPASRTALAEAILLARRGKLGIELLHVLPRAAINNRSQSKDRGAARAELEDRAAVIRGLGIDAHAKVAVGDTADTILAKIDELRPELVILGSAPSHGIERYLPGHVALPVVHRSPVPVLVVRARSNRVPSERVTGPRVIVGVDFTSASTQAVKEGAKLVERLGGHLILLHVEALGAFAATQHPSNIARLEHIVHNLASRGLDVTPSVLRGDPATSLLAEAEMDPSAFIVVGTRRRSTAARVILGSVADAIVARAPCAVLIAHAPEEMHGALSVDGPSPHLM